MSRAIARTKVINIFLVSFVVAQLGCSSTNSTSTAGADQKELDYGYTNILQMLRKESQLMISGPSTNPEIRVRGSGRSIAGSNEPLFVVDGAALGRGYDSIKNIDVNNVASIRVLSPARAGMYGARGGNGVVEIKTK